MMGFPNTISDLVSQSPLGRHITLDDLICGRVDENENLALFVCVAKLEMQVKGMWKD